MPISWFGIEVSYALAHGSLPLFIPFIAPGYLITFALVGEGQPESVYEVVFYFSQYISYALLLYIGINLKRYMSKKNENS